MFFEGVLKCKGINNSCKHPHIICRCPFNSFYTCLHPSKDVTSAYHYCDFNPHRYRFLYLLSYEINSIGINSITFVPHHSFTTNFQEYPLVYQSLCPWAISPSWNLTNLLITIFSPNLAIFSTTRSLIFFFCSGSLMNSWSRRQVSV